MVSSVIPIAFIVGIILLIGFLVRRHRKDMELLETVTSRHRGERSEKQLVLKLLKNGIPAQTIFHDLYIEKYDGHYSQVDVAVATKVGILVFEVKDYSGWIFGRSWQNHWTQVLNYGKEKHRFYNPIKQNLGHIKAIHNKLPNNSEVPLFSIVVFYGNSQFRDVVNNEPDTYLIYPSDVMRIVNGILASKHPAPYGNKREVVNILRQGVLNGSDEDIRSKHIMNIR